MGARMLVEENLGFLGELPYPTLERFCSYALVCPAEMKIVSVITDHRVVEFSSLTADFCCAPILRDSKLKAQYIKVSQHPSF